MPISELVPTAEGTPQPNTINMQSELVLTASVNNTSENEPGDLISTEFIYTTDGTVVEAYLASLSDEELEEFIASLPEDQAARVTALLPSDDKHLTE